MEEVKGVRYHKFKNAKLFKLLTDKMNYINKLKKMQKEIDKLAADGQVIGNKVQKIKDKVRPMVADIMKKAGLEEWDLITTTEVEGDKVVVQIIDQIEAEKTRIRAAKDAAKKAKKK